MKIADLSQLSFYIVRGPFHVGISSHKLLVLFVQIFELLQHVQSKFAIEVRVLHKLRQLGVVSRSLGQPRDWLPSQEYEGSVHSAATLTAALRERREPATMSLKFVSGWRQGNRHQIETQETLW